jgi:hypothetical protein
MFSRYPGVGVPAVFGPALLREARRALRYARAQAQGRGALLAILGLGFAIRVAVWWAYRPGIFYFDSWLYLGMAEHGHPVAFAPDRPSGYPLVLKASISLLGGLSTVTALQQLAGLCVGLVVYALTRRFGASRLLAVGATALVVLDGYTIALAQHVLPEALFALVLLLSIAVLVWKPMTSMRFGISGALLAAAILLRTAGVFAVPVWLLFVICRSRRAPRLLLGVLGLALPLLAYAALHDAATGQFSLTESDGWFLYQRVAEIGGCREITVPRVDGALCTGPAASNTFHPRNPSEYIYGSSSPATIAFGPLAGNSQQEVRANGALRAYAFAVIEQRPGMYAELVGSELLGYLEPWHEEAGHEPLSLELPRTGLLLYWDDPPLRLRALPKYHARVGSSGALARDYVDAVRLPGWVVAITSLAILAWLGSQLWHRRLAHNRRAAATAVLLGVALSITIGATATTLSRLRYTIPTIPLVVSAAALVLTRPPEREV